MPSTKYPGVSIIGAGTVGSTLARSLFEQGYPIVSIVNRTAQPAISLAKSVKCKKVSTQVADVDTRSEIIIIATTDGELQEVVKQLANARRLKFGKLFVVHTSGVHSSAVLEPLKKKGAGVASLHPIQTFPSSQRATELKSKLKGIFFGIEGEQAEIAKAERLIKDLGGHAVVITQDMKPLYHVACVFASGFLVVILNIINEISGQLKLKASWAEVFGPLMTTAMENAIHGPVADALTGPIIRKDTATIDLHLKTLAKYAPQFLAIYTVNGIETARVAKEHGFIAEQEFHELIRKFRTFVKTATFTKKSKVNG